MENDVNLLMERYKKGTKEEKSSVADEFFKNDQLAESSQFLDLLLLIAKDQKAKKRDRWEAASIMKTKMERLEKELWKIVKKEKKEASS